MQSCVIKYTDICSDKYTDIPLDFFVKMWYNKYIIKSEEAKP
jgi:hypothetical protein